MASEERRKKEIEMLNNLKGILNNIKQELHADLTKLAIKNLPMMAEEDPSVVQTQYQEPSVSRSAMSDSSSQPATSDEQSQARPIENYSQQEPNIQQLEPLDLDL